MPSLDLRADPRATGIRRPGQRIQLVFSLPSQQDWSQGQPLKPFPQGRLTPSVYQRNY